MDDDVIRPFRSFAFLTIFVLDLFPCKKGWQIASSRPWVEVLSSVFIGHHPFGKTVVVKVEYDGVLSYQRNHVRKILPLRMLMIACFFDLRLDYDRMVTILFMYGMQRCGAWCSPILVHLLVILTYCGEICSMLLGYVYPAYECFKIVERKKPDLEHLRFWCQYWYANFLLLGFRSL